jgi:dipeptidyl aminopeptidase/acylaminoacyl peptidase
MSDACVGATSPSRNPGRGMTSTRLSRSHAGAAIAVIALLGSGPLTAAPPPLIPRAVILEESERGNPELSPDGRRIAYSAPHDGVPSIWVRTVGSDDDRVVTLGPGDGVSSCTWQSDGEHVLYFKDAAGDENTHLFQTDIRTLETRDLTPIPGARARALIMDGHFPDTLLVHINARDRRFFDLYRLDLATGALRLDTENPGDVARFWADHQMRVRAADVTRGDGWSEVRVRDDARAPWRTLIAWGPDEMSSDLTGVVDFSADNTAVLVVTSLDANAERLLEVNVSTGKRRVLSEDARYDVAGVMTSPLRHTLEAVCYYRERMSWTFTDRRIKGDFDTLKAVRAGDIWVRGRDRSDRTWLVKLVAADAPTTYYLFDRSTRRASYLFSEDPKLEKVALAAKRPIQLTASDGTTIHGYLTLPLGVPADKLPLVVLVHGGPWTRDGWALEFPVQLLANRGYAVLQVNFRGSTGYGKAFQNAGNLEMGGKAVQDLVDAKRWAVAEGVADPGRVAIMGGSHGGYATLAALAFWPGEFSCGIAINAASDLNLLMSTMPAYWTVGRSRWETRVGKDEAFLRTISPLYSAGRIVSPLLLIHNANDVRVTKEHSERMAAELRERGKDVTFLLFPGAGHLGGGLPVNFRRRWAAIESFLGKHLGGRVEPPAEDEKWEPFLR